MIATRLVGSIGDLAILDTVFGFIGKDRIGCVDDDCGLSTFCTPSFYMLIIRSVKKTLISCIETDVRAVNGHEAASNGVRVRRFKFSYWSAHI